MIDAINLFHIGGFIFAIVVLMSVLTCAFNSNEKLVDITNAISRAVSKAEEERHFKESEDSGEDSERDDSGQENSGDSENPGEEDPAGKETDKKEL